MRLENLLQLKYRGIYVVISLVIVILVINNFWYLGLVPLYFIYLYKNHREIILIIGLVLLIYALRIMMFNINDAPSSAQYEVKVLKDIKTGEYTSFVGRSNNHMVKVFIDDYFDVRPGDSLLCYGEISEPINNTTPKLFNYKNYLKSQNIKNILYLSNCELKIHSWNMNIISYELSNYIDNNFQYSNEYIKTFILADKSGFDDSLVSEISKIGISHLFAVSGLHISLIVLSMMTILQKTKLSKFCIDNIIMVFLIIYMVITSFSPSVVRASLMFILLIINKRSKINISSLDILSLIFICLLAIRPYYYYNAGFLLSFLVTFLILLSSNILKVKSKIKQLFILSTISFFVTIPIILNFNYQINLLSLFFNIIFLYFITYLLLPLGYIAFLFPFLDRFYYSLIQIFEFFLHLSAKLDFFVIRMAFPNIIYVIIYYVILFYGLYSYETKHSLKKPFLSMMILFISIILSPYYNIVQKVTFLDIYGDSTIIIDRFNKCNIIIDTGEVDEYDTLVKYLKSNNINRIDYLIITHYHSDHYGETNDLLNNFKIINLVNRDNISEYPGLIECGNISFFIYPNNETYFNENNRSIILSLFISNKHYLFTGDIEKKREKIFIREFDIDVDYLKVPHHGSITSSTLEFIQDITPGEVFIIVSRKNRHNHPSDVVVSRYKELGIKVYRTDLDGTVIVKYIFAKEYKKVHRP